MKSKKIKFLSGVSSLTIALGAALTSIASATEPNPSMPNLSDSTGIASATESHPSMSSLSDDQRLKEPRLNLFEIWEIVQSASIYECLRFPLIDCLVNANENEIFDAIKSGRIMRVAPRSFFESLDMNKRMSFESKLKLLSYYIFIKLLAMKHQPLTTDEEINWDTYNQPDYKFCLNIRSIVEKNHFYGEGEPYGVGIFHYLNDAMTLLTEKKSCDFAVYEDGVTINVKDAFDILETICNWWL